jgi:hypothetical protein
MTVAPLPHSKDSAPDVSLAMLRRLVRNGQQRHPDLAGRMAKAATIVTLREITPDADGYRVESECDDARYYHVSPTACDCPDAPKAPRGYCKHRLAVALLVRCQEVERRESERVMLTPEGAAYLAGHDDGTAGCPWAPPAGHALRRFYLHGYQSAAAPMTTTPDAGVPA